MAKRRKSSLYHWMQVRKEIYHASTLETIYLWSSMWCKTGLQSHSEYSVQSVDGGHMLFNEDVFSGARVANVFLVILLECSPVGHQRGEEEKQTITKTEQMMAHVLSCGQLGLRGRASVLLSEGRWIDSLGLHVSLGKIPNPKLLLMCWLHFHLHDAQLK